MHPTTKTTRENEMDPSLRYTADRDWAAACVQLNNLTDHVFAHWTPGGVLVTTARFDDDDDEYAKTGGVLAWYDEKKAKVVLNVRAFVEMHAPGSTGRAAVTVSQRLANSLEHATRQTNTGYYDSGYWSTWDRIVGQVLGVVAHETAHAAWSNWHGHPELDDASKEAVTIMRMFEELRVERLAIDHEGRHRATIPPRPLLSVMYGMVLRQLRSIPIENAGTLAYVWALTHGRAVIDVVEPSAVEDIDTAVRTELTDDVVDYLDEILGQAVVIDTNNSIGVRRLRELAEEWLALVGSPGQGGEGEGEGEGEGSGAAGTACGEGDPQPGDGTGEPGEGEGEGEGEDSSSSGDDDGDEADGDGGSGEDDSDDDGEEKPGDAYDDSISHGHGPPVSESAKHIIQEELKEGEHEWIQLKETVRKMADPREFTPKVFGEKRSMKKFRARKPTPEVRQAVTKLSQEFEKVSMPQVTKTPTRTHLPPGRLNTREAVRRSAERSRGAMVTAKPWLGEKRRHTTAKPLVIGLATDTSGSMAWAEDMVADAAYVFAHAGHRIGARVAAGTFGSTAEGVVAPGELPRDVLVRSSNGSFEAFDDVAAALEGTLHLGVDDGSAKFVTIISDAQLVRGGEPEIARQWLEKWHRAGTRILWVGCTEGYRGHSWLKDCPGVTYVDIDKQAARYDSLVLIKAIAPSLQAAMRPNG